MTRLPMLKGCREALIMRMAQAISEATDSGGDANCWLIEARAALEAIDPEAAKLEERCPTCGRQDPLLNEFCSDAFHAPGETYWPIIERLTRKTGPTEIMGEKLTWLVNPDGPEAVAGLEMLVAGLRKTFIFICQNCPLGPTNDRTAAGKLIDSLRVLLATYAEDEEAQS